jgi:hypothetical protein
MMMRVNAVFVARADAMHMGCIYMIFKYYKISQIKD